jgi:hypothetical protein
VRPLLPTSVQGPARHRQCSRSCMVGVSVACRLGTPHIDSNPRQGARRTATCPIALDPASLLERVLMLPHEPRHWILPPCSAGLPALSRVPLHRTHLLAREGFSVVTCPMASDSTSLLRRASVLPHALRLWTLPPCSRGLQRCHVPHSSGPRLPAREGSGAATVDLCWPQTSRIKKA